MATKIYLTNATAPPKYIYIYLFVSKTAHLLIISLFGSSKPGGQCVHDGLVFVLRDYFTKPRSRTNIGMFTYYIITCELKNPVPFRQKTLWRPMATNGGSWILLKNTGYISKYLIKLRNYHMLLSMQKFN